MTSRRCESCTDVPVCWGNKADLFLHLLLQSRVSCVVSYIKWQNKSSEYKLAAVWVLRAGDWTRHVFPSSSHVAWFPVLDRAPPSKHPQSSEWLLRQQQIIKTKCWIFMRENGLTNVWPSDEASNQQQRFKSILLPFTQRSRHQGHDLGSGSGSSSGLRLHAGKQSVWRSEVIWWRFSFVFGRKLDSNAVIFRFLHPQSLIRQ